jgi:hypothetical protein
MDFDDEFPLDDGLFRLPENGEAVDVEFFCAACGSSNTTLVDPEGGVRQRYTEDCAVCCRPNLLTIRIDPVSRIISIDNELEYD